MANTAERATGFTGGTHVPPYPADVLPYPPKSRTAGLTFLIALGITWFAISSQAAGEVELATRFERHVRPILVERCQPCHGQAKQESGLRMLSLDDLLKGGDRGPSIVIGNASESLLYRAASGTDDELSMPPDESLTDNEVAYLKQWIDSGAVWPDSESGAVAPVVDDATHWAFQPLRRVLVPAVSAEAAIHNEIDALIVARLQAHALDPSPVADRRTLARRAYLDLTGLPPTYAQLTSLESSSRVNWFRDLVEHLLAQPTYGERWGRHWLDVARYADTKGYVDGGETRYAFAYAYRDYVIRAMNEDLPFDEMIVDQLAADEQRYEPSQQWRLAGMGFLTVGRRFNHNLHDTIDDQIDVISRGLLAITASCARCHNHKYDPFSTRDYYSLYGMLANSVEPLHSELPRVNAERPSQADDEYLAQVTERAEAYRAKCHDLHQRIEHELRVFAGDYLVYVVQESPRHRQESQNPLKTSRTVLRGPTAYGDGAIRRWRRYIDSREPTDAVFGLWKALDECDQESFPARLAEELARREMNRVLCESLKERPPETMVQLAREYGRVLEEADTRWRSQVERDARATSLADAEWESLRQVLYGADSPAQLTALEAVDCYHLDEHTSIRNELGNVEKVSVEATQIPARAMTLVARPERYDPVIFLRGRPDRPGPSVACRVPGLIAGNSRSRLEDELADAAGEEATRGSLAAAIVAPNNPFTARVIVNRVWGWHFGQPLVATPSDFGIRSEPPVHADLLDFLASWLVDHHWSLKELHRFIMSSATYQQASLDRRECSQIDPDNRLLWRFAPRRLEWEAVRDSLLSVSGRLDHRAIGRPMPLRPDDPTSRCRTLYLHLDRQHVPQVASSFDFPAPDFTCPQRTSTIAPQQQLFFLNSPFVIQQAESLADEALRADCPSDAERYHCLHRRVLARDSEHANDWMEGFIHTWRAESSGVSDHAFWTLVAHALLQSSELIYLE